MKKIEKEDSRNKWMDEWMDGLTSSRQAVRHASLLDTNLSALSRPRIILLGTLSNAQGRTHTLSVNTQPNTPLKLDILKKKKNS